ncbi:uncharacterized protein LOC130947365 [Arachis stenosperma]|uniref:uncharacterized protein LOC130947365 n=1 Tax=Arachis stenosperma TaxID=217475 RepID=UPI0025ABFCB3|nr:uncharacterized protein LOC130947365 [Arachis stenosperma]XP_057732044.1 uncharacterized protein LOC130947365 [Arachis stenosperma]
MLLAKLFVFSQVFYRSWLGQDLSNNYLRFLWLFHNVVLHYFSPNGAVFLLMINLVTESFSSDSGGSIDPSLLLSLPCLHRRWWRCLSLPASTLQLWAPKRMFQKSLLHLFYFLRTASWRFLFLVSGMVVSQSSLQPSCNGSMAWVGGSSAIV